MPAPSHYEPADATSAAALLAEAAAHGGSLVTVGHRTKLRTGELPAGTAALSTAQLTSGLAHYAGDLVATAPAGATLRDVNAVLARERQWIPLDPPHADATIGGIVACNDSGPRRHRFGAPRDLVIGIEVALTNGRVVHSGGRVVKNVAGYDLARLFCGSHGSLGLITAVTFKLAPMAPLSRTLVAEFTDTQHAVDAALTLATSASLTPSALELAVPHPRVLVRFETTARSLDHMTDTAQSLLTAAGGAVTVVDADDALWREHAGHTDVDQGLAVSLAVLPSRSATAVARVEQLAQMHGLTWALTGRVGLGVLRLSAHGSAEAQTQFVTALHTSVSGLDGTLHVHGIDTSADRLPDALKSAGSAASVGSAVKARFDPTGVFPYPWGRA